jgi:hypothetical protein
VSQSQILISLLLGDKLNSDDLEFGLEGGVNFAKISNLDSNDYKLYWSLGFYFDIRIKDNWFLYTGLLGKANMGTNKLTTSDLEYLDTIIYEEDGTYSQNMNYLIVPALIKYKFNNHLYLEAGPQVGYMTRAWIEYNSKVGNREGRLREFNKDQINRFDFGISTGIGYHLLKGTGWQIGLRYYWGLTNVYKFNSGNKNRSLHFKLNIPIGAGKAAKKQKEKAQEDANDP